MTNVGVPVCRQSQKVHVRPSWHPEVTSAYRMQRVSDGNLQRSIRARADMYTRGSGKAYQMYVGRASANTPGAGGHRGGNPAHSDRP